MKKFNFDFEMKKIIFFGLLIIVINYLYAYGSWALHEKKFYPFLNMWHKWDTISYVAIAKEGYEIIGDNKVRIVFLPFYPFLIKVFALIFKNYILSALIISNLCYILALIFLYKLVKENFSEKIGFRSILYLSIFPTSYFLYAGYSESTFLFLAIASFYFAKKGKWLFALAFTSLAVLTKFFGVLLVPSLLIEYFIQRNFRLSKITKDIFYFSLPALSLLIYLFLNYQLFGNPFQFTIFMKEYWSKSLTWPHKGLAGLVDRINYMQANLSNLADVNEKLHVFTLGWAELSFVLFVFFLTLFFLNKKQNLSYFSYSFSNLLLVSSTDFCLSLPRYVLSVFPIFIALGVLAEKKFFHFLITIIFVFFHGLFLYRFALGYWAF